MKIKEAAIFAAGLMLGLLIALNLHPEQPPQNPSIAAETEAGMDAQIAELFPPRAARNFIEQDIPELVEIAKTEPELALRIATQLTEEQGASRAWTALFIEYGKSQPEFGSAHLSEVPLDRFSSCISCLAINWGQHQPAEMMTWLRSAPESQPEIDTEDVWWVALTTVGRQIPEMAIEAFAELDPELQGKVVASLARGLADSGEPEAGLQYLRSLPEGRTKDRALDAFFDRLKKADPEKAAELASVN